MKMKMNVTKLIGLTIALLITVEARASDNDCAGIPGDIKTVCVHCAASNVDAEYHEEARKLGELLAKSHVTLVYGGAKTGLMGTLADSFLEHGGDNLVGITTKDLYTKYASAMHPALSQIIIEEDLSTRKSSMAKMSDAFIALPGGMGTLDEFTALPAEKQLGEHQKPVILVNCKGLYDGLILQYKTCVERGFAQAKHLNLFQVVGTVEEIPAALQASEDGFIDPSTEWWNNTALTSKD